MSDRTLPDGHRLAHSALLADGLLLAAAAIWGAAFVAQRAGMQHTGPFLFNGVRFALGAATLVPLLMRRSRRQTPPPSPRLLAGTLAAGVVLFVAVSLQQLGLVHTTAGKAGFITGLYVVLVPLLGLAAGHRTGAGTWLGSALAAAGLFLLSVTQDLRLAPGDGLVLAGAWCWAVHVLVIARLSPRLDWAVLACAQFACCAGLSLGVAAARETVCWADIRAAAWPLLYGGVASVGIGYTLQVAAQRRAPPAHAAVLLSLESVFAASSGWLLLGERLDGRQLGGCLAMLAGCLVSQLGKRR